MQVEGFHILSSWHKQLFIMFSIESWNWHENAGNILRTHV